MIATLTFAYALITVATLILLLFNKHRPGVSFFLGTVLICSCTILACLIAVIGFFGVHQSFQ